VLAVLAVSLLLLHASAAQAQRQAGPAVLVARIDGVINAATAQYAVRVIERAERQNVEALILTLDTPGGFDTAMRRIVQRMLGAGVPTVVYVSPAGARAGSAGVFLVLAADVAAMAPGTNIGAAHPVSAGPGGAGAIADPVMAAKVTNDAAAYARSLAQQRGRNADWAERAVRESDSIPASEALRLHVVDEVASDVDDLLAKLDGRRLRGPWGERVLRTRGATIYETGMNPLERAVQFIADPTIAYLLFTIGSTAILAELYNPGAIVPGVVGSIALLLALVGLGSLPVNLGGLALLLLAIGMFIAELKVASHGLLAVGGIASFVLGSLLLFSGAGGQALGVEPGLNPWLIGALAGMVAVLFGWLLQKGLLVRRRPPLPIAPIPGDVGQAESALDPTGTVLVRSELWTAVSRTGTIPRGKQVRVVDRQGLTLVVEPAEGVAAA
jgi:membrane-bound serine protease (ClpP class)